MLCDMGNKMEVKHSQGQNSPTSDVHTQLHGSTEWMKRIHDEVVEDLINFEVNNSIRTLKYKSTWAGCLRFIRSVDQHWQNKPRPHLSHYVKQGNYKEYFLQVFPELPLLVHKVIRSTGWKSPPDLEEHFATSYEKISLPSSMSDNDYDDIDKTPSAVLGVNESNESTSSQKYLVLDTGKERGVNNGETTRNKEETKSIKNTNVLKEETTFNKEEKTCVDMETDAKNEDKTPKEKEKKSAGKETNVIKVETTFNEEEKKCVDMDTDAKKKKRHQKKIRKNLQARRKMSK
ncbi:uncharacterized protein LOC124437896 isoform X2 [Xenia sp. Carnegie-2017]|uniref:uncharacterized protein LOC124437896 isoform X2 n=1 Tax=Xenia sp. Carnegie-2017 TaxID=2897299 RepID=UPI001F0403DA|nr:uncharacterized protein LOC124437896 isoform X2 [Xenia sp. Carnegie-2017]